MVGAGAVVAAVVLLGMLWLLRLIAPKVGAIAWATGKEAVSQPLFYVIAMAGAFLLVIFLFLPYFTMGEDLKMVEDNGLTLIMFLSVILALWMASTSIADEIEGRTALTVLCKPIGRREFLLGKFLGILGPVFILFIILGAIFLCSVSFKLVYDARESAMPDPTWLECRQEVIQIAPGLVLALLEAIMLAAISVAISTRLPMLPNLIICASIYVLGNLVPMLAQSAVAQKVPLVPFVADLLATVLPVLAHFNIYGAITRSQVVPWDFLAWAGVYCALYTAVAMLVALLLFEDRDLA
jgi:ABC-type transport system involved in multi-copper enzyme maturation permease subunit